MRVAVAAPAQRARVAGAAWALTGLAALSIAVRVGGLDAGYWIDEAISVGIASHDVVDIPRTLREDGSPPLYYLLLHGWMMLAGTGEAVTRSLSLGFAVLAVPVAWWAGRAVFGARAGWLAAAGAALCPFLSQYAQETRMYSLVAVLSLAASAGFVLAFLHGQRVHLVTVGVSLVLLLYTHNWGLFLLAAMAIAWLGLWRRGDVSGRDGLLVAGAVALAYAPWVPSLLFQAGHTGAPWAERPALSHLVGVPGRLFHDLAVPLLAFPLAEALRRRGRSTDAVTVLLLVAIAAAGMAWLSSQVEPAWATRYLAVLLGPILLALAGALAHGGRWTALALAAVAVIWLASSPPTVKSNARTVAEDVRAALRPGDLVVSTQPEQVPVLARYLPDGLLYVTPTGVVGDPGVTDWRDGVARLRAARVERHLGPLVAALRPGGRILLVTPVAERSPSQAPWSRAVRHRSRQWRAALRADPRLRLVAHAPASTFPRRPSAVRAEVLEKIVRS